MLSILYSNEFRALKVSAVEGIELKSHLKSDSVEKRIWQFLEVFGSLTKNSSPINKLILLYPIPESFIT